MTYCVPMPRILLRPESPIDPGSVPPYYPNPTNPRRPGAQYHIVIVVASEAIGSVPEREEVRRAQSSYLPLLLAGGLSCRLTALPDAETHVSAHLNSDSEENIGEKGTYRRPLILGFFARLGRFPRHILRAIFLPGFAARCYDTWSGPSSNSCGLCGVMHS
jgi:hypothetical protein